MHHEQRDVMGAQEFYNSAKGKTAKEAFAVALDQALYDFGHAGYTGTLAEKNSFVMIEVPEGQDPAGYAEDLMQEDDYRIADKFGDAGCVKLGDGEYLFFGNASS